jgi:putative ABC transport system ATP-binding protein
MARRQCGDGDGVPAVVSLDDVVKIYQRGEPITVLDGLSLDLGAGSFTAVMGPSGSGKSTVLNLIGCLDTPTSGSIRIEDREVTAMSGGERAAIRGAEIGFVFQTFNLMPKLSAVENVALPLVFLGWSREDRLSRARDLLDSVGLGDEPTGSLDTETGERIMDLLHDIHEEGNTILLVTHERLIAEHAERIVHVLDGEIERTETVDERRPRDPGPVSEGEPWTR